MGQIWRVFHVLCGLGWPLETSCAVLHHGMAPFSICCHAVVLFTSSCQMGIITNAFIANVIKPNITSIWDEADSTGAYTAPTNRLEMGLSHLQREGMHWKSFWCTGCQLRTNFSVVNVPLPALGVPEKSLVAQSNCDTVLSEGLCSLISQLHSYFPMRTNCFLQVLKCIVSSPCISLFWCRSVCGTLECERSLVTSKYALVQGLSWGNSCLSMSLLSPFIVYVWIAHREKAISILDSFQSLPNSPWYVTLRRAYLDCEGQGQGKPSDMWWWWCTPGLLRGLGAISMHPSHFLKAWDMTDGAECSEAQGSGCPACSNCWGYFKPLPGTERSSYKGWLLLHWLEA